jgi:hypothetical protein
VTHSFSTHADRIEWFEITSLYRSLTNRVKWAALLLVNRSGTMAETSPPPTDLPAAITEPLAESSAAQLRDVAQYATALAEQREKEALLDEAGEDGEQIEERPEDLPEEVPTKATLTTKTINESRYVYWQWREGDTIKSKYKGPATSDE